MLLEADATEPLATGGALGTFRELEWNYGTWPEIWPLAVFRLTMVGVGLLRYRNTLD